MLVTLAILVSLLFHWITLLVAFSGNKVAFKERDSPIYNSCAPSSILMLVGSINSNLSLPNFAIASLIIEVILLLCLEDSSPGVKASAKINKFNIT